MISSISSFIPRCSRVFLTSIRNYSMELKCTVNLLEKMAPLRLAGTWDNVGLLIEPATPKPISSMMLTNDLTEEVMKEAEDLNADFILSYHPPLFAPLKRITQSHWKERIASRCLEKGIAVYSPHTSYDALKGGVNDWLISAFGVTNSSPITMSESILSHSHWVEFLLQGMSERDELYARISRDFQESCIIHRTEDSIVVLCNKKTLPSLIENRYEGVTITKLEQPPLVGYGEGRISDLDNPITVKEAVERVKSHINLPHVRLAVAAGKTKDSMVRKVAVCAGAGTSVLKHVNADLLLTGEMSHHEILDIVHKGTSVILTDHSNSERGFLQVLKPKLEQLFDHKINVIISKTDCDPLLIV